MTDKQHNATCAICGKPYTLCLSCNKSNMKSWKVVTDTAECFTVYTILHQYTINKIDKVTAKEKLMKCDLSKLETYPVHIRNSIDEIMSQSNNYKYFKKPNKFKSR